MKKKMMHLLITFLIIISVGVGIFFYSAYISVDQVNITHETIISEKITKDLNNIKVAFLSDIVYQPFMNKDRLSSMFSKLNANDPDVIIFGGDLFSDPMYIDEKNTDDIIELLSSLRAPLGKFAVLGDLDQQSEEQKQKIIQILEAGNFEIITNSSIRIHNKSNASINVIGLDSLIHGNPDIPAAFKNVNEKEFNILVSHAPDIIKQDNFPLNSLSLVLAGHAHGSQLSLPFIGGLNREEGAKYYPRGQYTINHTIVEVIGGLGTQHTDIRLFSPPEILIYTLKQQEK